MRCPCINTDGPPGDPQARPAFRLISTIGKPLSRLLPRKALLTLLRWLYLAFFNGLWVVFPAWILYEAYQALGAAMSQAEMVDIVHYLKKDD